MKLSVDRQTLRLATTYWGVMVFVSVIFSAVFYVISAHALHLSTVEYRAPQSIQSAQGLPELPHTTAMLRGQTSLLKHRLIIQLAYLNVGVLIVGCAVSYHLARRALQPLRQAMDIQQHFFFDASHELKTPLSALHLKGDVALRNPRLTLSEAKATISSNIEQVEKLEHLTHDLLQLAKADHVTSSLQTVSLSAVARQAARQLSEAATARSMRIINSVHGIYACSNEQQLIQVVAILLDNAIKYGSSNTSIYIEGQHNKKEVILVVRDEGPGIDAADLPHIFERFYQADSSRKHEGFGLGLSIASTITRQLHGIIRVNSSPNGSSFSIHLPVAKSTSLTRQNKSKLY